MSETEDVVLFISDEACAAAIARVGEVDRELARISTQKDATIAAATREAEDRATPFQEERAGLARRIEAYCAKHRGRLTDGRRSKTAAFTTGECSWKVGKGRVIVSETLKERIIEQLRRSKRLVGFIRTRHELDLTKIGPSLRDDPKSPLREVRGLRYEKGTETFSIAPAGAELVDRPQAAAA